MGELMVPEPDDHVGSPSHSGVHRAVPQKQAKCGVVRIGGDAADGIAGVDIFEANFDSGLLAMIRDGIAQEHANVAVFNVT